MKQILKVFMKNLGLRIAKDMAYKWNFIIKSLGMVLWDLVGPIIGLIIYTYSLGIPGWSFPEFILLIGTMELTFGFGRFLFLEFPFRVVEAVREGEFDLYLTKPFNTLLYLSADGIDIDAFINVVMGTILITWAMIQLNISAISWGMAAYLLLIFFAVVFQHALMTLIAAIAIISVRSYALLDMFFRIFDLVRYPITIYSSSIQFFLTFLFPIAIMSFYPAVVLTEGVSLGLMLMICTPIIIFWTLTVLLWHIALKKYSSAGG